MDIELLRTDTRYLISPQLTSTDYPDVDLDRNLNRAYQLVLSWIIPIGGDWEINGDIIYRDRQAGVSKYDLPNEIIRVYKGEVLDRDGGQFVPLNFTSVQREQNLAEGNTTRTFDDPTRPTAEMFGNYIQIRPVTDTTVTNGIKLWVQLCNDDLNNTTNKVPNLVEPVKRILSMLAALDYAIAEEMDKKINNLSKLIYGDPSKKDDVGMKGSIEALYSTRSGARRDQLKVKRSRYN